MEDMKAVYRLNEEKLDYNLKVLSDREEVNLKQLDNYKNRERRLRGTKITVQKNFDVQQ